MKSSKLFSFFTAALLTFVLFQTAKAQTTPTALQTFNMDIQSRTERVDPAGWLYFRQNANVEENQIFTTLKMAMGLGTDDAMILEKSETDDLGYKHNRYQQFYKNVEVEDAEYMEHIKDCYVEVAHGKLAEGLNKPATPVFSESQALQNALNYIGATEYEWQNSAKVAQYKEDMEDPTATLYPKGKLIFAVGPSGEILSSNYTLVWRFTITATIPLFWKTIDINAITGLVHSNSDPGFKNGPATLSYGYSVNGPTTIDTRKQQGLHDLNANENSRKIETRNGNPFTSSSLVQDTDDNWDTPGGLESFTTAHWAASQSWDYWKSKWNHKVPKNNNDKLKIYVAEMLSPNPLEAMLQITQYDPAKNRIILAPGVASNSLVNSLDAVGHEFTHGVIIKQSELGNKREPGALGESFANIFGEVIERYTFPNQTPEWLFEEDLYGPSSSKIATYSLKDPDAGSVASPRARTKVIFPWIEPDMANCPDPDALGQDNCFIHTNSGVQDRWFYLLSDGGSGFNMEAGKEVGVQGLGLDKAVKITQYSLFKFIQSGSKFADARESAINSARILFGPCSHEVVQTTNAWAAVNVGLPTTPCISIVGSGSVCAGNPASASFEAFCSQPGVDWTWNVPSYWIYTLSGPGNKYLTVTGMSSWPPTAITVGISAACIFGTDYHDVYIHPCNGFVPPCPESESRRNDAQNLRIEHSATGVFAIFPSPTFDDIFLKTELDLSNDALAFEIISTFGQIVKTGSVHEQVQKITLSDLPAGNWVLRVQGVKTPPQTIKFIKSE